MSVWQPRPGVPWEVEARLRFYGAVVPRGERDRMTWYQGILPAEMPETEVISVVTLLARAVSAEFGSVPQMYLVQGDGEAAVRTVLALPFAYRVPGAEGEPP
jgi:hypothetical protein